MFDAFFTANGLATLATLSVLEVILGIDNLVFIAILVARLEPARQPAARRIGLGLAMITRCLLLATMSHLAHLTHPTGLTVPFSGHPLSFRDLVLLGGGFFLLYKATKEIHEKLEEDDDEMEPPAHANFVKIIFQIVVVDIIFSLDSVVTAVGIADELEIMIAAVILAVMVMIIFSGPISNFINRHPSIKMLALSFLILIGCMLVAEGTGHHINKGYIYFAMFFSLTVEWLNLSTKKKKKKARLALKKAQAENA
ncbi:MAG: TerC family protein [Candidatus Eremiobacteraeota bacterium]|nr:TerC family protein [Candidatus Eremiobacteraeota bacterium]MCW5866492.1 TerC family protein [Candidatus Eremiobacteraeota bacterium]